MYICFNDLFSKNKKKLEVVNREKLKIKQILQKYKIQ